MFGDINKLVRQLGSENRSVHNNAIFTLLEIGAPAVEPLCKALCDSNCLHKVRRYGALVLGRIGERGYIPRQILLNTKMSEQARVNALNALREFYYFDNDENAIASG